MNKKKNFAAEKTRFAELNRIPERHLFVPWLDSMLFSAALKAAKGEGLIVLVTLMADHIRQGCVNNGKLRAQHRELIERGIHPSHVARAIDHVVKLGLVQCHQRGREGSANRFSLTWLPLYDGTSASNLWREYAQLPKPRHTTKIRTYNGHAEPQRPEDFQNRFRQLEQMRDDHFSKDVSEVSSSPIQRKLP